jgi:4-hydroxyphenylacetate 3-monooxygenase
VERRRALEAWAGLHFGFMGRSPDHVASCISGMFMGLDLFEAYDPKRAAAVRDYYRFARDRDLFLTYVIINPQADRGKAAHAQADPFLAAGVVDEDAAGLTIRASPMRSMRCRASTTRCRANTTRTMRCSISTT